MASKGRLIMDTLSIGLLDPEYSRSDMLDQNPMVWMIEVSDLRPFPASSPASTSFDLHHHHLAQVASARI
jgi:hypothetical protein